jgi:hypothetical protein
VHKSYRRLAALPLGVGLILVVLILKFQGLLLFELSQILRQLPIDLTPLWLMPFLFSIFFNFVHAG